MGRGVAGVEQHQAEVVAEVERGEARLGIEAVEEGVEERRLGAGLVVAAVHLVVADAGDHGDQPAVAADHVLAVVAQEGQADLDRPAVVVAQVAADDREHRVLPGRLDVVGDGVGVDAAIAAGDEVDRVGGLGRHRAEAVGRRLLADAELVVGPRREAGQLGAEDLEVGQRVRLGGGRLGLPAAGSGCRVGDVGVRGLAGGADPLHGHGRGRVALPGEEQRTRLERRDRRGP